MNSTEITEASLLPDLPQQSYLNEFSRHQQEFKAHLRGRVPGTQPLPPTYFPPASYWTSAEKDLFFHGLTIYSRLRPDLIAEHIKTKNIFDVCLYLDCLEMGASQAGPAPEIGFNDEEKPRNMTEPAMEVSEEWIQHEEIMAARSNASVSCPWTLGDEARLQCLCPGVTHTGDNPSSRSQKKTGKEYLAHLDFGSLFAVESIIKDEERKRDPTPNPFEAVVNTDDMPATPQPQEISSGDVELSQTEEENFAAPSGLAEHADPHDRTAHRRLQKRLYMRRKRAEQTGREITFKAAKLRPGRASGGRKEGSTADRKSSETEVSPTSTPGPESENDVPTQNTEPEANADGEQATVEEEQRKGGLNKAYRVKQILLENGIDAGVLSMMNLDLFHLTSISRILKLFKFFDGSSDSADTSISVDTLHLLSTIVVEFVSELIRRAIVSKEQEIRLKQSLPIWKYDKHEISGEHLQECLKSMELDHLNKSNYFNREASRLHRPLIADRHINSPQSFQASPHTQGTGFTLPDSMIWCSLPAYRKIFPTDEITTDVDDVNLLAMELLEEQQISLDDSAISERYEESLWTTHYLK